MKSLTIMSQIQDLKQKINTFQDIRGIYVNYGRGKNTEVNQYACYINYYR